MFKGIDHIGIAVSSIGQSIEFYRDVLGMTLREIEEVPEQHARIAFITVGPTNLEFLEPTSPDSPIAKFIEKKGCGVHHVAVEVDDLESLLGGLKAKGVRLINEKPVHGAGGKLIAFVHPSSTGGILLELCQQR